MKAKLAVIAALTLTLAMPALGNNQSRCILGYTPPDLTAIQATVQQQRALWVRQGITAYEFTYQPQGFTRLPALRISVQGNTVQAWLKDNPSSPWSPANPNQYRIEQLFERIESSASSMASLPCGAILTRFDAARGFPVLVIASDETQGLMDGFAGYKINDFKVLP